MIQYCCVRCGTRKVNRFLEFDANEADSMEALLKLSGASQFS
jgi:hypothetical protein